MPDVPLIDSTLVAPIALDDRHGRMEFDPKADITSYEGMLISVLFLAMTLRRKRLDWREYLNRDWGGADLARHFKNVDG